MIDFFLSLFSLYTLKYKIGARKKHYNIKNSVVSASIIILLPSYIPTRAWILVQQECWKKEDITNNFFPCLLLTSRSVAKVRQTDETNEGPLQMISSSRNGAKTSASAGGETFQFTASFWKLRRSFFLFFASIMIAAIDSERS